MNSDPNVPEDVVRFVRASIDSVETLRVLLLLRARRERTWAIDEISAELRSSTNAISQRLNHLAERGMALRDGERYRYAASGGDDANVQRLGRLYRERRTTLIDTIFSGDPR